MFLNVTMDTCITNGAFSLNKTGSSTTHNQLQQRNKPSNTLSISDEARIFLICLYVTIFVFGVTGNAIVCWVVGKKRQLSGSDVFTVFLAFADLLASICAPVIAINDFLSNPQWKAGPLMCKVLPSISAISFVASSWSMVLIGADRYRAIVTPLKHRLSVTINTCVTIVIWTIAIIISFPYTLIRKHYFCSRDAYVMTQMQKDIYVIVFPVIGWVIPISIISVVYGICIRKLQQHNFNNDNNESMKRRTLENKKVIRMFILISILFCIFTLPFAILYAATSYLLDYERNNINGKVMWELNYSLVALSSINSCMNPFIYAKRQTEMKAFIKKVWRKLCCKALHSDTQIPSITRDTMPVAADMKKAISKSIKIPTSKHVVMVSFQKKVFDE